MILLVKQYLIAELMGQKDAELHELWTKYHCAATQEHWYFLSTLQVHFRTHQWFSNIPQIFPKKMLGISLSIS